MTTEQSSPDVTLDIMKQLALQIQNHEKQIQYLIIQVQNLYARLGLVPLDVTAVTQTRSTRTETGMGVLPGADQTSYL
jgi:hypothetical protein